MFGRGASEPQATPWAGRSAASKFLIAKQRRLCRPRHTSSCSFGDSV